MARDDIRPIKWTELQWGGEVACESVAKVREGVENQALSSIAWYIDAKRAKSVVARWLRAAAILLTACAGILPMIAQVQLVERLAEPIWASVSLGIAATCVSLDRFFGFSSAWARFIAAEMELRSLLHQFQQDSLAEGASWEGKAANAEQIQRSLARCKVFLGQIDAIVQKETSAWIAEFQDNLKQIDEAAKATAASSRRGAINLTVTNGDQAENGQWMVSLDDGAPRAYAGKTAALPDLAPGQHKLRVSAKVEGKQRIAEAVVNLPPGGIAGTEISL